MDFYLIAMALLGAWLVHHCYCLGRNYLQAASLGIPIMLLPLNPDGFPWIVISVPLRPIFQFMLSASVFEHINIGIFGWQFANKAAIHERFGPVLVFVTPKINEIWIADPLLAQNIMARRNDFVQPYMTKRIMTVLGPNLLTADGDIWARQRKLIAPTLNEKIMQSVWDESTDQAKQMSHFLLSQPGGITGRTLDGLRHIAINVIGKSGYGQTRQWSDNPEPLEGKTALTYFDAIHMVMFNLLTAAFFSPAVLQLPFTSKTWRQLGQVKKDFSDKTKKMLEEERFAAETRTKVAHTFMATVARLSESEGDSEDSKTQHLTDDEIQGNLFLFTAAGYDTTANTMGYAVALLAVYPQWQRWVQEEIDEIFPDGSNPASYEDAFPRLTRSLAVMYETLRLYPPVIHVAKTVNGPQHVEGQTRSYYIPGNMKTFINTMGLHHRTDIWGEDANEFRPSRWVREANDGSQPSLIPSPRRSFVPWSAGPRVCPGQKMSQVEFTAAIGTLFRSCNVEPAPKPGFSEEQLRERLSDVIKDSQPRTTLQMKRPSEVVLKWSRRR